MKPVLAISVGCPCGIGPEVALSAAAATSDAAIVLVGARAVIERAAKLAGVAVDRLVAVDKKSIRAWQRSVSRKGASGGAAKSTSVAERTSGGAVAKGSVSRQGEGPAAARKKIVSVVRKGGGGAERKNANTIAWYEPSADIALSRAPFGRPTKEAGAAQLAWIDQATDLVRTGIADALVTGPVSKSAIASSSRAAARFRGHTEHLASRLGAREVVMAFWSEELVISLVTTHLPITRVARAITPTAVATSTYWTADLARRLGKKKPRIVVSGLNPHAGEDGLLGTEEPRRIAPGIAIAQKRLARSRLIADIVGPMGAESAIRHARAGRYDAVVAMYHDQATIPMKLVGFGEAVNVTLGLPIVRTSVDHGTGYDIAGMGKADARGMRAAIGLAGVLARRV